jgi:hypothetical protein
MDMHLYETLLREANEIRCRAFELSSGGHHALADLKMAEIDSLVRIADAEAREASVHARAALEAESRIRNVVETTLRFELGEVV